MKISAKADYAVRAMLELAVHAGEKPCKGDAISRAQDIPLKFLENILVDLRRADLVRSQRGAEGGYWLARDAADIPVADVIRAVDGPLACVRGERPETVEYADAARNLPQVWVAVRASIRAVLEQVSIADVLAGELPTEVQLLTADPEAWSPH
ncbi:MAG: Rrf2 family transcriptional regulator [Thermoleophilia bacterium]|nr:Rrf2 family transcriptional regulator [Thermoleophilia bacterium]